MLNIEKINLLRFGRFRQVDRLLGGFFFFLGGDDFGCNLVDVFLRSFAAFFVAAAVAQLGGWKPAGLARCS